MQRVFAIPSSLSSRRRRAALFPAAIMPGLVFSLVLPLALPAAPAPAAPSKKARRAAPVPAAAAARSKAAPRPRASSPFVSVSGVKAIIARLREEAREREEEREEKGEEHERERERERKGEGAGEEEAGTEYLEAHLEWLQKRAFPYDAIDQEAYVRAAALRDRMPVVTYEQLSKLDTAVPGLPDLTRGPLRVSGAARVTQTTAVARWEFTGPRYLTTPYVTYYGPAQSATSGRVNGIAFAPSDPNTAYLAAAGGGVWKTTDGGASWVPVGDFFDTMYTNSVAVDPTDPNTVYVGMGDYHGYKGTGEVNGVMKSTNGGRTWVRLGETAAVTGTTTITRRPVSAIAIDPDDRNTLVISTGRGSQSGNLFRSTDGGVNWYAVGPSTGDWDDVEVGARDSATGRRFYYASRGGAGLFVSGDRGATWTQVRSFGDGRAELAASAGDPLTVYLMLSGGSLWKGVRASTDPANNTYTWTDITTGFPTGSNNYNWSQSWYDLHLTAAWVGGRDIVYAGAITLSAFDASNSTWTDIGKTYTGSAVTHNDQHCVAVNPQNPAQVLVGNDGGVYRATYAGGTTWNFQDRLSLMLGITQFYYADWHPTDPVRMIGGAQDNASPAAGTASRLGDGTVDPRPNDLLNWDNVGAGDGAGSVINPSNPNIQYTSYQYQGLYRTTNNWSGKTTFAPPSNFSGDRVPFIGNMAIDPNDPDYLYVMTQYLYRYRQSTNVWEERIGGGTLNSGGAVVAVAVAPGDSSRIYAGDDRGVLWMSTDRGASFTQIQGGTSSLPGRAITSISVAPTNPSDILVGVSGTGAGHLWRCTNTVAGAARAWQNVGATNVLPDFPLNAVTRDPADPARKWYVATDGGVFYTPDGGASWGNMTAPLGLPNVPCTAIKAVAGTGYLNVATFGRGMWRIPLVGNKVLAPAPAIRVLRTAVRSGTNLLVTLNIQNTGGPASNLTLSQCALTVGTTTILPSNLLPDTLGSLGTNQTTTVQAIFPVGNRATGTAGILSTAGTYTGGSFSSAGRVTL
jgi:hypothetical protein